MGVMAILVPLAVFYRYVINQPINGAGELSIFLLIYITFLGGSLGLKYKSQASVTILTEFISDELKRIVSIVAHILMLLFLAIILYYCYQWILSPNVAIQKSSALRIPMWIPYSIVPIGLTFASIHLFSNLLDIIRGGESK